MSMFKNCKIQYNLSVQSIASKFLIFSILLCLLQFSLSAQEIRGVGIKTTKSQTRKRLALVIGNGSYKTSPLRNPLNDAKDMAAALRLVGFEVILHTDINQNQMKKAISNFGKRLRTNGGTGLFYFAGHGVQVQGKNYLIPIGAKVETEEEIEFEGVDVGRLMAQMKSARNSMNIVVLDACRNNPFVRSFRSSDKGLASIDAPSGTIIAYSTAPGSIASDGTGRNGLYTQQLLKNMKTKGLSIEDIFKQVRISVRIASSGKQTPWESSSLTGDFYFLAGTKQPVKSPTLPTSDEILLNFSNAVGHQKLKEIKTIVQKGTFKLIYNGRSSTGIAEYFQKFPEKQLSILKFSNGNRSKETFNGEKGWISGSTTGTKKATPEQLNFRKRSQAFLMGDVDLFKKLYSSIIVKEIDKHNNRDVYVLVAKTFENKTERLLIDVNTNLLVKWEFNTSSVATQEGITFTSQIFFDDYVSIRGFQFPFTHRQKFPNGSIIVKYSLTELKLDVPLEDKLFKKP